MKKILNLILVFMMLCLLLTSCKIGDSDGSSGDGSSQGGSSQGGSGSGSGDSQGGTDSTSGFSLKEGAAITVVTSSQPPEYLLSAIEEKTGVTPTVVSTGSEEGKNEIIIGESDRPISKKAYRLLGRTEPTHNYEQPYLIYCEGDSVALAYIGGVLDEKYAREYLCEYFTENLLKNDTLPVGALHRGELDAPAYQEAKDSVMLEGYWERLREEAGGGALGDATVSAMQKMYSLYNDNAVLWLADLYDPTEGGFYYSNSGRNTDGFLPDIESTSQALTFLTGTGMTTSVYDVLPAEIREQIVAFVRERQRPNGYFYHPQWEISAIDNNPTRRGRDLSGAEAILSQLRAKPIYTTPNGVKGDGSVPEAQLPVSSNLTATLGTGVSAAASRVLLVSDASIPEYLRNEQSFRSYLGTLDINKDSYGIGSLIVSQAREIKARDAVLKSQGATYSLVKILEEWLNSHCYESTGTWKSVPDYEANNGLLKISDAYNILGIALPYPAAAVRTAVNCITSDDEAPTVCFPYNTWFSVNNIFDNLTKYNPQNAEKIIEEIRQELRKNISTEAYATYEKVLQFAKIDGSFSYLIGQTSNTSEGMPVALPHTNEGDVNATFICTCGTANGMFRALGYTYIPIFTESDMMRFTARLDELGEIVKGEYTTIVKEADFDVETAGNQTNQIVHDSWHTTKTAFGTVVADPREERGGNVLRLDGTPDGGKAVMLELNRNTNASANCIVFEGEFCMNIPEGAEEYWAQNGFDAATDQYSGYVYQLHVTGVKYNLYQLGFDLNPETGKIKIFDDSSSNGKGQSDNLGFSPNIGEWFKIKIEYFVEDHDSVRIRVYFNDELYVVTDNYYSPSGDKHFGVDETQTLYTGTRLSAMSYKYCSVMMDNLVTYRHVELYRPTPDPSGKLTINVDPADREEVLYSFEGNSGRLPEGVTVTDSSAISVASLPGTTGTALKLNPGRAASATFPINTRGAGVTATVFESDVLYASGTGSGEIKIYSLERNDGKLSTCFLLKEAEDSAGKYLALYECANGTLGSRLESIRIPIGVSTNLRIEFYKAENTSLIYVDGVLMATSTASCAMAYTHTPVSYHIENMGVGSAEIYLDNILTERIKRDYDEASSPPIDSIVYDFESGAGKGVTLNGTRITGGKLQVEAKNVSDATFPINVRDVIGSATVLECDLYVASTSQNGTTFRINFLNSSGSVILSYVLTVSGTDVFLYEAAEGKIYDTPLASFKRGKTVKLRIEYYTAKRDVQIFIEGSFTGESSLQYSSPLLADRTATALKIASGTGSGTLQVDNLKFESLSKNYLNLGQSDTAGKHEENILDFDNEITSSYLEGIEPKLVSVGSKLRIEQAIRDGISSKYLSFDTNTAGGDIIYLVPGDIPKSYTAFTFETDIRFDDYGSTLGGAPFQLYFQDGTRAENPAYMTQITYSRGFIAFQEITGGSEVAVPGRISGTIYRSSAQVGDWFNLRIEYYLHESDGARILVYVNGSLLSDSSLYYNKSTINDNPAREIIDKVRLQAYSSTDATVSLDNVKFTYSNAEYAAPEITEPDDEPVVNAGVALEFEKESDLDYFELSTTYAPDGVPSDEPLGSQNVKLKIENGALVLYSPIYHRNLLDVYRTSNQKGDRAVFEADVTLDMGSLGAGNGGWIYFSFYDQLASTAESPIVYVPLHICINRDEDGVATAIITNEAKHETETALIKDNVKFTLRLEYLINPYGYCNTFIYIKAEGAEHFTALGRSTVRASTTAPSPNDIGMVIELPRFENVTLTLDNLIFESQSVSADVGSGEDEGGEGGSGSGNEGGTGSGDNTGGEVTEPEETVTDKLNKNGVAILGVKGGKNGIVVLIHDDGNLTTGNLLDGMLAEYGLIADVGMIASVVYDVNTGSVTSNYSGWKALLDNGRWGLVNHSMTHGIWGEAVDGSFVTNEEALYQEVVRSGEILRELFEGHRVLTFAYPGHDSYVQSYGSSVYEKIRALVEQNYIAGRHYSGEATEFYAWDYGWMPAQSIGHGYLDTTLATIDAAAAGKFATIFVHNVRTDEAYDALDDQYKVGNSVVKVSHMEPILERLSGYVKDGSVWNAHYEEAILYLREAECATVSVSDSSGKLEVTLTDTLDNTVYNYPLTVRVKVNSSWEAVKIHQNGTYSYALVEVIDGVAVIDCDLVPDAGVATLTPISADRIPTGDIPDSFYEDVTGGESGTLDFDDSPFFDGNAWVKPDEN